MRFRSDLGITSRRRQGQDCVFRIVKRVNDVMRRARMIRILLIDLERNRAGPSLQAIALVARLHQPEQRQGIKGCRIQIVRIVAIDLFHRR